MHTDKTDRIYQWIRHKQPNIPRLGVVRRTGVRHRFLSSATAQVKVRPGGVCPCRHRSQYQTTGPVPEWTNNIPGECRYLIKNGKDTFD
jgi:hypothetical protein